MRVSPNSRQSQKETYTVPIKCSNCGYDGTVELPKGTTVPSSIECSNCGCETASKRHEPVTPPFKPWPKRRPIDADPWTKRLPYTTGPDYIPPIVTLNGVEQSFSYLSNDTRPFPRIVC